MRLLRLADVPPAGASLVFRRSPARALAAYALTALATGVLAWFAWRLGSWLLAYLAALLVIGLLLTRGALRARLGSANWLVRLGPEGMHVQFRSHLNAHMPAPDLTVVSIPYADVRSARAVREHRTVAYRDAGHRSEREVLEWRRYVELELAADTTALAQALADELARTAPRARRWYGSSSTTHRHYPVRLSTPSTLELEWRVTPSSTVFLEQLGRFVRVEPVESRRVDFRDLDAVSRAEQERRIATLAQTGQEMAALSAARSLFGLDLAEARDLVERLRRRGSP